MKVVTCRFCGDKNTTKEDIIFLRSERAGHPVICSDCVVRAVETLFVELAKKDAQTKVR